MAGANDLERLTRLLIEQFPSYVAAFEAHCPFSSEQKASHLETIRIRRECQTVSNALNDSKFLKALYTTLQAWGIGKRASKLVPIDRFGNALRSNAAPISSLEGVSLAASAKVVTELADVLWSIIDNLGIVENDAKLVAGTKALHHVLPELVTPMDREYTGLFFGWWPPAFQNGRRLLRLALPQFARVAQEAHPESFVRDGSWCSSVTKVIDNAVIGRCQMARELVQQRAAASSSKK